MTGPALGPRTPIATPTGHIPAAALRPGDLVLTPDGGPRQLRQIRRETRDGQGSDAPVRLRAPFFGLPADCLVSPGQLVALRGAEVDYLFAEEQVLAEARHLADGARACRAPYPGRLLWLSLDLWDEALVLSGSCALATSGADRAGRLRRLNAVETRALLDMHDQGLSLGAA